MRHKKERYIIGKTQFTALFIPKQETKKFLFIIKNISKSFSDLIYKNKTMFSQFSFIAGVSNCGQMQHAMFYFVVRIVKILLLY